MRLAHNLPQHALFAQLEAVLRQMLWSATCCWSGWKTSDWSDSIHQSDIRR
jgi:hypothetical protein